MRQVGYTSLDAHAKEACNFGQRKISREESYQQCCLGKVEIEMTWT